MYVYGCVCEKLYNEAIIAGFITENSSNEAVNSGFHDNITGYYGILQDLMNTGNRVWSTISAVRTRFEVSVGRI